MIKKMLKVSTLVLILGFSSKTLASDNSTFEQLKRDMWLMGLDFEYQDGGNIIHQYLPEEREIEKDAQNFKNLELLQRAVNL